MNPWDKYRAWEVVRGNEMFAPEVIERGCNFFVLALEHAGATPNWCCEGHPKGFYVSFSASLDLALKIESAGFFTTELSGPAQFGQDGQCWVIRLTGNETGIYANFHRRWSQKEKQSVLRLAALSWVKLGLTPKNYGHDKKLSPARAGTDQR